MMNRVFLSLGSNLGDKEDTLRTAIKELQNLGEVVQTSSFFITKPWGGVAGPDFVNCCVELSTAFSAQELLSECQEIEDKGGRERKEHWGDRTLDIDIVTFNNDVIDEPDLQIPHPYAAERDFVLDPLAEICDFELVDGRVIIKK